MNLSFIIQFKIDFLLPFTGCRKVLGKMPDNGAAWISRLKKNKVKEMNIKKM